MAAENIATLGIVVNADGAIRQVDRLGSSLNRLGATSVAQTRQMGTLNALHAEAVGHIGAHSMSYGRLENALASFSGHAIGVPPVLEKLSVAMGKFAIGSIEITGVLLGIAAVVTIYEHLTSATHKAAEEQGKLTDALARQFLPKTGPRSQTNLDFKGALAQRATAQRHLGWLEGSSNDFQVAQAYTSHGEAAPFEKRGDAIKSARKLYDEAQQAIEDAYAGSVSTMKTVTVTARDLGALAARAQTDLIRFNEMMRSTYGSTAPIRGPRSGWSASPQSMSDPERAALAGGMGLGVVPNAEMPVMAIKKQLDELDKTRTEAEKHAKAIQGAIENSAQIIASVVSQALNIGGGGRGAGIGGMLGAGLGQQFGSTLGAYGGPIGMVVGGLLGSALGGLFDHHKNAVDKNTQALNNLNASLLNSPGGFKVQYYNNQAADAKRIYRNITETARRESARGGRTGFALQAA